MKILVAYESKYGATEGIAARIGDVLKERGLSVDVLRARDVRAVDGYDGFVVGSAAYFGAWMGEAATFAKRHAAVLRTRPLWLFSSGPVGAETVDAKGNDIRAGAITKTIAELSPLLAPREHHVFWGALDRKKLGFMGHFIPAVAGVDGDFRDWEEIRGWAEGIAQALVREPVAAS